MVKRKTEGQLERLEEKMNNLTPEQEYLALIAEKKTANDANKNGGEFFWGFSSEQAENTVVELCQKHKCQPSQELIRIAHDSINRGSKGLIWTLERNIKRHLEHLERMSQWEKEAESKAIAAEKAHDESPITKIFSEIENNGFSCNLWEKYGKVRIYVYDCFGSDCGYIDCSDISNIQDKTQTEGLVSAILRNLGV
jgi:hypothetical protein